MPAKKSNPAQEEEDLRAPLLSTEALPPDDKDKSDTARFKFPKKGNDSSVPEPGGEGSPTSEKAKAAKGPSFTQILFRFATAFDYILLLVGSLASVATGCAVPLVSLVFGNLLNVFNEWPGCVYLYEISYDGDFGNVTTAAYGNYSDLSMGSSYEDNLVSASVGIDPSGYLEAYPCPWLNEEGSASCDLDRDPRSCIAREFLRKVNSKLWWFAAIGGCTITCGYLR